MTTKVKLPKGYKPTAKEEYMGPKQLEYFRRYQLEGQAIYYRNRGRRHETDARRAVVHSAVWMGVAGCLTASAGILASLGAKLLAVGAFGVVAQAMASRLTSRV